MTPPRTDATGRLLRSGPTRTPLPLPSDAAEPVPGPALGVGYGQDAHLVFPDEEDERVREAGEQGPPDLEGRVNVLKAGKRTRAPSDER